MPDTDHLRRFRLDRAGRLRATQTPAERRLWRELHRIPIDGTHFRRQIPIGPYVADFACLACRLVVELDGDHHGDPAQQAHDADRTAILSAEGFRVLRFWNHQVMTDMTSVLDTVHQAVFLGRNPEAPVTHRRERRLQPTPGRPAARPLPSRQG